MKLYILENNKEKIKESNNMCDELKISHPEIDWESEKINHINDVFYPYSSWLKEIKNKNIKLIEDTESSFEGIYITRLNWNHSLEGLTEFTTDVIPYNYGVCDNASQVIELLKDKESGNKKYIITMVPMLKELEESEGGWRWHKWGSYIGVQERSHEYLYDEENIDLIYVFSVSEIK